MALVIGIEETMQARKAATTVTSLRTNINSKLTKDLNINTTKGITLITLRLRVICLAVELSASGCQFFFIY